MNRITEFVDSFIPENIPDKKKKLLREELICHLLDKTDYYMEIGYDECISRDKAIEEFGTDEDMKNYIRGEFEELYKERTVWGILAALFIWGLNILCFPLDLWSYSADFNRDPDPLGAFMSFLMIFAVIGLIVFAGNSFVQLPITTDYVSAKMFLNSITTESVPIQGTAIGDAINTAMRSFSAQSEKSRAIIVITDGENHEDDPVAAAEQAAEMGVRVFTIGVGSPEGKPIPFEGELMKDKEGNIVVTRLDEKVLQDVAIAGNGVYVRAGNSEFGLNPVIEDIKKMEDERYSSIVFEEYDEQFMYFLGIALFFFVLEMLVGDRRSKRHLFKR